MRRKRSSPSPSPKTLKYYDPEYTQIDAYMGITASTEEEARGICDYYASATALVHKEEAEDPEEQPTWVFSVIDDAGEETDPARDELLHQHYQLPNMPNLRIEFPQEYESA